MTGVRSALRGAPVRAPGSAQQARRGLLVFFVLVVLLSAPLETGIVLTGALDETGTGLLWVAPLMCVPAVASVLARLALREGFDDVSFRLGRAGARAARRLALLPVLVAALAHGGAAAAGLVDLDPPALWLWGAGIVLALVLNAVFAMGEEVGWRGYMVTRLVRSGCPAPLLTSGIVWGLWHVPLVLWGGLVVDGPAPEVSAALLVVTAPALGYVLARSRTDTGSVWPAVVLHVAWNTTFQAGFDPATTGARRALWVGEFGVLTALLVVAVALVAARRGPVPGRVPGADADRLTGPTLPAGS